MKPRAGDWVEVRSREEILRTLDKNGRLEGLPFMPQMFGYCGRRLRVYKRAHKTCDTVNQTGGRRVTRAVHLETRCDGEAYGGCQSGCLIFWKEAWLRPVASSLATTHLASAATGPVPAPSYTEADVWSGTKNPEKGEDGEPRYICQATELPAFTTRLPWWDVRQYFEDFFSGNATLGRILRGAAYSFYSNLAQAGIGLGRPMRLVYDLFQKVVGGIPYPRRKGKIPAGQSTPTCALGLRPGELVRVKSFKEILATLDTGKLNRGLYFDPEHVPYCGGTYRVKTRVEKYIEEKTGRLKTLKNPSVILEGVWCRSRYSDCRMFCPRSIYSWWREVWLERVQDAGGQGPPPDISEDGSSPWKP